MCEFWIVLAYRRMGGTPPVVLALKESGVEAFDVEGASTGGFLFRNSPRSSRSTSYLSHDHSS
ncbi:hypothetical protein Pogu_1659 [Pyrobaculum oguniense TE7]|uniref:Uncharacterized protein n=1 Tax=Pyrobaculum oguniense (strain DSM 13380 / JCM 10595 / TE7) TaxID=698757 RepID=H6QAR0_PYROT|nr:hypothetical protein Pogu_1659 [Pyrobaculum oguniense TE7]